MFTRHDQSSDDGVGAAGVIASVLEIELQETGNVVIVVDDEDVQLGHADIITDGG
ncbi:hypothetical protein GCM10008957_55810 [Deinococcus ruber]|uniref:Uncharacterized protein n=1 Tax=Deinococcus ruber TaxID=1848197 RepID=A0A918FIP1_9DEIO|nr:hypothetical protein GCM10008957_55810 [Deinococcus ruber]